MLAAPSTAAELGDAGAWYDERRIIARRSIGPYNKDTWKAAYQVASRHGITSGEDLVDAEFLSGWIALRYVKSPDTALKHFARVLENAESRTDKARGGYWAGRAYLAAGDKASATKLFKAAAQHSTIYYGQLAREYVGLGGVPEEVNSGAFSNAAANRVEKDEVVRALRLMHKASGKANVHMFLYAIASRFKTVEEMNAAADIVHDMGGTYMALKLAKAAGQFKVDIDSWSYPLRGLPDWKQVGKPVEKALVFGLSRQESEFNPTAGSRVGAQGLMQIMPATAKLIARQHKIPYRNGMLTSDPAMNVKMGAAHLGDLIDNFNGSYVLTLVAYNAGPRRAREWTEQFGDLRSGQVDPVDWVENIPFQETRQYVQKVMQNLHVYRSRLAPKTVRPMTADLKRGQPSDVNVASITPAAEEKKCGSELTSFLAAVTDHFHTASDGTKLYARMEGGGGSTLTPLLCLPGLTRNSADFDPVFARYSQSRKVIGMDFRGRGCSAFAADPKTYRPDVELEGHARFSRHAGHFPSCRAWHIAWRDGRVVDGGFGQATHGRTLPQRHWLRLEPRGPVAHHGLCRCRAALPRLEYGSLGLCLGCCRL